MPVIVTIDRVDRFTTFFNVEGIDLPEVVEEFIDVRLSHEIDIGLVYASGVDGNVITISHDDTVRKEWYVKVVDAVKDCVGDDHEVLSRLGNWP